MKDKTPSRHEGIIAVRHGNRIRKLKDHILNYRYGEKTGNQEWGEALKY